MLLGEIVDSVKDMLNDKESMALMLEMVVQGKCSQPEKLVELLGEEQVDLMSSFISGSSPAEVMGVDPRIQDILYKSAYQDYQQERYEKATYTFQLLAFLNPNEEKYFFGLASCLKKSGFFIPAHIAFTQLANRYPDNPLYLMDQCECEMALESYDDAKKTLEKIILVIGDNKKMQPLLTKAKQLLFVMDARSKKNINLKETIDQSNNNDSRNEDVVKDFAAAQKKRQRKSNS